MGHLLRGDPQRSVLAVCGGLYVTLSNDKRRSFSVSAFSALFQGQSSLRSTFQSSCETRPKFVGRALGLVQWTTAILGTAEERCKPQHDRSCPPNGTCHKYSNRTSCLHYLCFAASPMGHSKPKRICETMYHMFECSRKTCTISPGMSSDLRA